MAKKYIVREGFNVFLAVTKPNGEQYERTHAGGEEVVLEDNEAALHAHKLEFANQRDRDAAMAAEQAALATQRAQSNPAELVSALVAALQQAQGAAAQPAAPQ